jgi:hypothetical protein
LGVHFVEGFILNQGHIAQRVERDYGYDLLLYTFDQDGYAEPGLQLLQDKASERVVKQGAEFVFDMDVRDYNLWMLEQDAVILILFDASRKQARWLDVQQYFRANPNRRPKNRAKSVRVRFSAEQMLSLRAIAEIRRLKLQPQLRILGDD